MLRFEISAHVGWRSVVGPGSKARDALVVGRDSLLPRDCKVGLGVGEGRISVKLRTASLNHSAGTKHYQINNTSLSSASS